MREQIQILTLAPEPIKAQYGGHGGRDGRAMPGPKFLGLKDAPDEGKRGFIIGTRHQLHEMGHIHFGLTNPIGKSALRLVVQQCKGGIASEDKFADWYHVTDNTNLDEYVNNYFITVETLPREKGFVRSESHH